MIIQGSKQCYEVMSRLDGTGKIEEFVCQEQYLRKYYMLVRIEDSVLAERYTLFLERNIVETEFQDYKECFWSDGAFYMVFTYSPEQTLRDKMNKDDCTVKEKAEIIRKLLEQFLLRNPHPYFMLGTMNPDMITVTDSLDVSWNYHLDEAQPFDYCRMETVYRSLEYIISFLFEKEIDEKQYPLLEDYLARLVEGNMPAYLELYLEFLSVYETLCEKEQDDEPKTYMQRFLEECSRVGDKPDSLKGYFSFGKRYVAKKLVIVLALLVIPIPLLFLWIVYPWIEAGFLTKTMVIDSVDVEGYTGKVRLVGDLEEDNVIFMGMLADGKYDGQGTLYDSEGNLIYRGGFLTDQYSGMGESYYRNGNVEYAGQFAGGQYEGPGKLYDENGVLLYEGGFSGGMYEGDGILYYSSGLPLYEGNFSGGLYDGSGTLYYLGGNIQYRGNFSQGFYDGAGALFYENGVISYEGEFFQGEKSGSGKEYDENGELLYDGTFSRSRYEGEGTLYENGSIICQGRFHMGILTSGNAVLYDIQGNLCYQGSIENGLYEGQGMLFSEGILIYEGGFANGKYNGSGKEYQAETGMILYDGTYEQGRYSGQGRLYDQETGGLLYEGSFYQALYDGEGKLYDPSEGYLLYEGGFREGFYDGQGKEYSEGILLYEGEFFLGTYNGKGILYDPVTGTAVFEGIFYNNQPVEMPEQQEADESDGTGVPENVRE